MVPNDRKKARFGRVLHGATPFTRRLAGSGQPTVAQINSVDMAFTGKLAKSFNLFFRVDSQYALTAGKWVMHRATPSLSLSPDPSPHP